ncbi:MAG: tryptophan-rich sensory protein [Betaproteobacteria bacterium]|nr:tryptophan-rich sensory protein [Betaproteobacteria bacterium]
MTAHYRAISPANQALALAIFLGLCFAAAAIGGAVTADSVRTWYPTIVKPSFNPPNAVFAPVWTILYAMMAVAAWRVWRVAGLRAASPAFTAFAVQLVLNVCWSVVFFGLHAIGAALIEIVVLLAAIVVTTRLFWRHDRIAGLLFIPYVVWVCFALVLNTALWRLNATA